MNRYLSPVVGLLVCFGLAMPSPAEEPPGKLPEGAKKQLEAEFTQLNQAGLKAYQAGKYPEATKALEEALIVARRLYNRADYPDAHPNLATAMNNLASLYRAQGKLAEAEPLFREALAMLKRLFQGDHVDMAAVAARRGRDRRRLAKQPKTDQPVQRGAKVLAGLLGKEHRRLVIEPLPDQGQRIGHPRCSTA